MRMAEGSLSAPCYQDDGDDKEPAADADTGDVTDSGRTHAGSLQDEDYGKCDIIIDDILDSDGSMSDPFEDAQEDLSTPLVNGCDRVPSYSQQGPCDEVVLPARFTQSPSFNSKGDIWNHTEDISTALSWLRQEIVS